MGNTTDILKSDCTSKSQLYKEIFCKRLKEIREEQSLSQNAVANKLGCAISTYANWEQGRREPSISDIFNLIYVFKIEANDLFYLEQE